MSELDVLRGLGEQIVPPPLDSLRDTARRRTRRNAAGTLAAAGATIAVVTAVVLLGVGDRSSAPGPAEEPVTGSTTHPLTYADGATIHYGGQTIEAEGAVVELDLTDQGLAFRTRDGRIWFADGGAPAEIGALGDPVEPSGELANWLAAGVRFADGESGGWIVSGNTGAHLMWFDFTDPEAPEAVVYDTGTRAVVLRTAVDLPAGTWAGPHSVTDDAAYLFRDPDPLAEDQVPQVRLDLTTGAQTRISPQEYLADVGSRPARSFLISHEEQGFRLYEITEGTGHQFDVHGGRLRPMGMQPIEVRDGLTEERIALRAPTGYPDANPIWLVQWLDDDKVAILDPTGGQGRLLVCPVPAGTCELAVTGPGSIVVPDFG